MITRNLVCSVLAATCMAVSALGAGPAPQTPVASGKSCPVVAVLDMNKIFQESKLAQQLQSRLKGLDDAIKQQLGPMADAYQKRQSDYDLAKDKLSPEERNKEEEALRDMQQQLSTAQQQAQQAFNQQRDALAKQMREQLLPAVESVAKEKGWDIVLAKTGADVIWASDSFDGSDAVIARLNAAAPASPPTPAAKG